MVGCRTAKLFVRMVLVLASAGAWGAEAPAVDAAKAIPWDLKRLSAPPPFQWIDAQGPVRSLFYDGETYGGKPTRVFAYYATPATPEDGKPRDKSLPAVVLLHGGGGTAFREWTELWAKRGYAAIAMDLAGCRPAEDKNRHQRENRERLPDGGPDQGDEEKFGSIDMPIGEQWSYHAVAAALRAHSLVRSFAEVDAERTAVTGISWGGYLTSIVAGVDPRFKAAVPIYGCGFLHHNSAWLERLTNMTHEQRERWVTLWDPSRYLKTVSMPILFINGTNDFAYPLDSYMKSYDAVPGAKQIRVTVNMPHSHPAGWAPQEIGLFVDQHLQGGKPLPTVGEPRIADGKVRVRCASPLKLVRGSLHLTTAAGAFKEREWQSAPATIDEETLVADVPPAEATAWFVTVADERGAIVSSRVVLRESKNDSQGRP
jgi:cephalosporin-C deacetylase-like acetyl esterase